MSNKRVGSISYQVNKIIKQLNGVGTSKKEARENRTTSKIALNGRNVSKKIHSVKYLADTKRTLINLGKFAKENYGIKDFSNINIAIVKDWINSKNIGYRGASNYLSILNKVRLNNKINGQQFIKISGGAIQKLREELRPRLPKPANETRAYKNLDKVKIAERYEIAFRLQKDYGLRVTAATKINLEQLKGNTLTYKEKGGKISQKELSPELAQKIRETAKNGGYKIPYSSYQEALQKAIESTGQKYTGTHGIRHYYAQKRLEEGLTKAEVSQELGHNREDIIRVYLR